MPASESTKVQLNFKVGDTLINAYAADPTELDNILSAISDRAAAIAQVDGLLKAASNVAPIAAPYAAQAALAGPTPDAAVASFQAATGGWPGTAGGQPQAQPTWNPPAQQVAQPGIVGAAPQCVHGARKLVNGVAKSGPNVGKPWSAWMCPSPKGTPGQCKPEYVN